MDFIYVGEITNTHGIKGEVRLLSKFEHKKVIFKKKFNLYVGKNKEKLEVNSYRIHKNYDMLTFANINSINDILIYKGESVYVKREDLPNDLILNTDLINYEVIYNKKIIGKITEIVNNNAHDVLIIRNETNKYLIPYVDEFIEAIDKENKKISIKEMSGLIDEN